MNIAICRILQWGFAVFFLSTVVQLAHAATDVTISTAATSNITYSAGVYTPNAGAASAVINTTELQTHLTSTNVTVNTSSTGGGSGDITVNNAIAWNSTYGMTLSAIRTLTINATITNNGIGGITLLAGQGAAGNLINNSSITTSGGRIIEYAGLDVNGTDLNHVGTVWTGALTSGGGNINVVNSSAGGSNSGSRSDGVVVGGAISGDGTSSAGSIQIIGRGDVTSLAQWNWGVHLSGGSSITIGHAGSISITGTGGVSSQASAGSAGGVVFDGASSVVATGSGAVTVTGTGGTSTYGTNGAPGFWTYPGSGTSSIYSSSGTTTVTGISDATSSAVLQGATSTLNIGWDGGSNVSTGNVTVNGNGGTTSGGLLGYNTGGIIAIRSNGGAVTVGDNGSALGGLTLNSGTISSSGNYKSFYIGGTNTNGVTVNTALTTNATADNTIGIKVVSKTDATIGASLTTSAASGIPVTILAAQGASGTLTVSNAITTSGGAITLYAGLDASGASTSQKGSVIQSSGSTITSGNGTVLIKSSTTGGVDSTQGVSLSGTVNAASGSVTIVGKGGINATDTGVYLNGASVSGGDISITGSYGMWGYGFQTAGTASVVGSGNVTIKGTGSGNEHGIFITGTATTIRSTGTGKTVILEGVHTNNSTATSTRAISITATNAYIGWDGGSNVSDNNIVLKGSVAGSATAGMDFGNLKVKSNGGAVTIGDNGASLAALTVPIGVVDPSGSYKSFTIGGMNTSGVTVNAALTTNATADNTVGIKVVSNIGVTIGATLNTGAASGIPVLILAGQGAAGAASINSAISTNGGAITLYAGRDATGADLAKSGSVNIAANLTSNGGAITAVNSASGASTGVGVADGGGNISSGVGNITLTGYGQSGVEWAQGVQVSGATVSATSGTITINGKGGNASGGTANMSSGVLFGGGSANVYTTSGSININAISGTTNNTHGINFWGGATYKIYSTSGVVNIQTVGGSWGIVAGWTGGNVASNVYIGWDGASTITSGAVNIQSANAGSNQWLYNDNTNSDLAASPFQIRSTGAIALGSQTNLTYNGTANLSGNNGLTVSNAMLASGAMSYLLGDVTTSGMTENVSLATNATADNTIGIKVVSKTDATIGASLTTSAASSIPVTVLAAQGAAGVLSMTAPVTSAGGDITIYAGRTAVTTGYNTGFAGQIRMSDAADLTSGGGNITVKTGDGTAYTSARNVLGGNAAFTGDGASLGQVINAAGGNIDMYAKSNGAAWNIRGADIKTTASGAITITGVEAGSDYAGVVFENASGSNRITSVNGVLSISGDGGVNNRGIEFHNGTTSLISATGDVTLTGTNTNASLNAVEIGGGGTATLYLGYDGSTAAGTTGNITVTGQTGGMGGLYMGDGSTKFTYIKSNGGAVKFGDNGNALGAVTLNSGMVITANGGNYKSFYIGGTNTSGVTINAALTTNATADNTVGIKVVSKSDATIAAALTTSAATGIPVTVLAAQGANGTLADNGAITTAGGTISLYGNRNASGTDLGTYQAQVSVNANLTSGGGSIGIGNSSTAGVWMNAYGAVQTGGSFAIDATGSGIGGSISISGTAVRGGSYNNVGSDGDIGVTLRGSIKTNNAGSITVTGAGGNTGDWYQPGILLGGTSIQTQNGVLTLTGVSGIGGGLMQRSVAGILADNSTTDKIYSTGSGSILLNGITNANGSTSYAYGSTQAIDFSAATAVYIGYDGTSDGTTGDISVTGNYTSSVGGLNFGTSKTFIKSNGGAVTIGDNGSSLSAFTLNSGTIVSSGNYKSFYIGGSNTNGVTINAALTTNATADNTIGIKVVSKSDATIAAALTTSAASSIPVTVLAGQGAAGNLFNNSSVTTSGGTIIEYAGRNASGTDLNQVGTVWTGILTSGGGNITVANSNAGGSQLSSRSDGVLMNGSIAADGTSSGGNISITGKGDATSVTGFDIGVRVAGNITTGHTGSITITGTGGVSSLAGNGSASGVMLDSNPVFGIFTYGSGAVTLTGTGGSSTYATNGAPGLYNYEGGNRTVNIYSGSGTTSITANSNTTSSAILEGASSGNTSTLNIGWDGSSNIGTGDVLVKGSGGTTSGGLLGYGTGGTGNIVIRSNGGAVTVGDNGSALGALTLNSGTISSAGNYKSFYIGGTNTTGVTVNTPLTTNATADNAVGIKVVSKSTATISAALNTANATGIPVSILAAQGAAGNIALGTSTITANGGTITLDDATTGSGNITGTGSIGLGSNGGLVLNTAGTTGSLSGIISGSGSGITKNGSGLVTLSGVNTYTGATTISAGTLKAGNASAFGIGSAVTDNATMDMAGYNLTIGSLAGSGTVTESSATAVTLTTGTDNTSTTFSGVIQNGSGTVSLIKNGTGAQTLSGINTYTGNTTINAGKLVLNPSAASSVLTTALIDIAGGTLSTMGIGSGYTIDGSANTQLKLSDNGFIELDGTQVHSLKFKPSTAQTWTSGKTLSILNWKGARATSGTKGKIYVGTNNSGLTGSQTDAITFNMPSNANTKSIYLSTGEVVALVDSSYILFTIP